MARLSGVEVTDLAIHQTLTLFHPDGLHPQSTGQQHVYLKLPRRQRVEQTIEGQQEVRLSVADRVWIRRRDGKVYEAPPAERERDRMHLMVPFRRSAADLLAEWRSLGIRDDITHVTRLAGRPVTVIGARAGDAGSPAVWLDPERGVVRVIIRERLPKGPAVVDLAFSEHRPLTSGFSFPHRQEAFVDGRLLMLVTVRSVVLNPKLSDDLFDPEILRRGR